MSQSTLSEILWQQALEDNDFARAEKIYHHLQKTDALDPEQCTIMGLWYQQKQDYSSALHAFQTALILSPDSADELYYQIALCYFETEQFQQALKYLELSLEQDPRFADAIYLYAETLANLGQNEKAVLYFKRLLTLISDDVQLCISIAASLSELDHSEEALEIYHRSLLLEPQNFYLFSNLGAEYTALGDYDDALYCHQRALELNNFNADLWYNLACTYAQMHELTLALNALEKAINIDDSNKEYARYDDELAPLYSIGRFWKLLE